MSPKSTLQSIGSLTTIPHLTKITVVMRKKYENWM